jgi:hypothetical protein
MPDFCSREDAAADPRFRRSSIVIIPRSNGPYARFLLNSTSYFETHAIACRTVRRTFCSKIQPQITPSGVPPKIQPPESLPKVANRSKASICLFATWPLPCGMASTMDTGPLYPDDYLQQEDDKDEMAMEELENELPKVVTDQFSLATVIQRLAGDLYGQLLLNAET